MSCNSRNGLLAGAEGADGCNTVAQHLLLDFLADRHQQRDPALSTSARSFLTSRLLADELTALRSAGSTPSGGQQSQMLQRYHTLAQQLDKGLKCTMNAGALAQHSVGLISMVTIECPQGRAQCFQHDATVERPRSVCTYMHECMWN